ncbi:MAG: DUF6089 family protein [Bacteroidales bacterium]|nr:DUF6089 family protein [Bacteroidales bacterium]
MKKIIFAAIVLISGFHFQGKSQELEVGLFGGGSYYLGDINPGLHFMQSQMAYGLSTRYILNDRLAARLSIYRGNVAGDDAVIKYREERNLNFESPVTDISAVFEFNFLKYYTGSKRNYITPYIFGGVSTFFFNPKANGIELKELGTEGQNAGFDGRSPYSGTSFAIPFGVGLKYSLTNKIGLGVEWMMHKTFTDYLDDISTTYYLVGQNINPDNEAEILSDPTMSFDPYQQRGNKQTNDWFAFFGLSLTYKFDLSGRARCLDNQNF